MVIGSSESVRVGQPVVALGAPLGLSGTVTSGIVSALDRTVRVPGDNGGQALLVSAMQTDAAINPGNSGGALVNCDGELVGVPAAGATIADAGSGNIGLGFAIPVDSAIQIADEIIKTGSVTHAFFGLGNRADSAVCRDGPAARAGLRVGDVITEIDGEPATSSIQIESLTLTKRPGDTVDVTYARDGRSAQATITLGSSS